MVGGNAQPFVFLVAGEPSGDEIGARLIAAMKERTGGAVRIAGVGGEAMAAEGLDSLFPLTDIAVMGLVEVLPRAGRILARMSQTARAVRRLAPDVVVTIDAPGFAAGVWKRLRGSGVPLVHYVAPTVWAWRPGRAATLARRIDHLLTLLPFEPPYFEREGLPATFVGHPALESGIDKADGAAFRARHGLGPDPVLGVLPGSRAGEIARLMPVFRDTVALLTAEGRRLRCVIPTVAAHLESVRREAAAFPAETVVVSERHERHAAMAACDVALAASGTVTVELAVAGVPMVVGYRLNPLTAAVVRRLVKVRYASLVNLILDRPAIPEFLLGRCRPALLADALGRLLDDPAARAGQRAAAGEALARLAPEGLRPSARAAEVVLDIAARSVFDRPTTVGAEI